MFLDPSWRSVVGLGCLSGRAIARPFAFEFVHVVPAKAGTHFDLRLCTGFREGNVEARSKWIPAFAGMTG